MQKTLAAATLAVFFGMGGAVSAADVYSAGSVKDPVYVAPNTWAGFYIGLDLGGLVDDNSLSSKFSEKIFDKYSGTLLHTFSTKKFALEQDNKDEPIGGVHIGYNFQNGNLVYGIEGDANFGENIDYLATIRGRLGYTVDSGFCMSRAAVPL
jgi:outer membrane immunogenic protein